MRFFMIFLRIFAAFLHLIPVYICIPGYFNESRLEGETAFLPCNVTSADNISLILWYKGKSEVPIYTVDARPDFVGTVLQHFIPEEWNKRLNFDLDRKPYALLHIDNVGIEDDEIYRCRVDFQRSRTRIYQIKLTVIVPPSSPVIINEQGRELNGPVGPYNEGASVRFICNSYDGNPPPNLSWWREGVPISGTKSETSRGVVKSTLAIPEIEREDLHTELECQASNSNRTAPARKRIVMELNLKPLEVAITSSKKPLSASKLVKLSCDSGGSRPPAVLTWWLGSKKMTKADNKFVEETNLSKSVLTFVPSSQDDGKFLACRAENPSMANSAKEDGYRLQVHYIPVVTLMIASPLKTDEPYEGEDVFLDCHAQASPKVNKVQWFLNNRLLHHDPSSGVEISPWTLRILSVSSSNRGKYVCVAKNSEGTGWSNPIYLTVKHAPVCKKSTKNIYRLSIGESAKVLCQVEANPPDVNFSWSFNESVDHSEIVSFTVNGLDSVAQYKISDHSYYGYLMCWATNTVGVQTKPCVFQMVYAGRPEPPVNCTLSNGTSSILEVICYPGYNGGLNQTFVMEVYDEVTNKLRANITSDEDPKFVARNLPSGSAFNVKVYAYNAKGVSKKLAVVGHTSRSQLYKEGDARPLGAMITPLVLIVIGIVIFCILLVVVILTTIWRRKRPIRKSKVSENTNTQPRNSKTEVCIPSQNTYYSDEKNPDLIPYISGVAEEDCKMYYSVPLTNISTSAKNLTRNHCNSRPAGTGNTIGKSVMVGGTSRNLSQQNGFAEDDTYRRVEEEFQYPDIRSQPMHKPESVDSWKSSHSSSNSRFGSISRLRIRMSDANIDNEDEDHHLTANTPLMESISHSESTV